MPRAGKNNERTEQVPRGNRKLTKFGLFSIRENLENIGGHFEIDSKPRAGCRATMTAPIENKNNKKEV